ncbi:MAG: methyltransferase domain-containing protein [Sandaracinaceae bacterium]|nr:methyltransferase domain-containing protein [Sandaracinaceae bacterium]
MASLTTGVTSLAYGAQHLGMLVPAAVAQRVVRLVGGVAAPTPDRKTIEELRKRLRALMAKDLANVEEGLYPRRLLFQVPVGKYARAFPRLVLDFPRSIVRRRMRAYRDLPDEVDDKLYPPYFRRTFHWQTDGYLSRRSAELYDVGVEFLFAGTADVMRRQVIPPITRWLEANGGPRGKRLLDVACGTGRTLAQLQLAHPALKLYGLDLSPYYVQLARESLDDVALVAENAEAMPFADATFDVVTSTYLFHELPKNARRKVLAEMVRVLKPGGLVVIEDSGQLVEAGPIAFFLQRFPEDFHEPFYAEYLADDLAIPMAEAGLVNVQTQPCFVAKVIVGDKPR